MEKLPRRPGRERAFQEILRLAFSRVGQERQALLDRLQQLHATVPVTETIPLYSVLKVWWRQMTCRSRWRLIRLQALHERSFGWRLVLHEVVRLFLVQDLKPFMRCGLPPPLGFLRRCLMRFEIAADPTQVHPLAWTAARLPCATPAVRQWMIWDFQQASDQPTHSCLWRLSLPCRWPRAAPEVQWTTLDFRRALKIAREFYPLRFIGRLPQ